MQECMKAINHAIEWHEKTIEYTRDFFDAGDSMPATLRADLLEQLSVCDISLDALRYIKERGGFI